MFTMIYSAVHGSSRCMQALKISEISSESLKDGMFIREFPEFYALQGVVEHGSWHEHQDVFEHCIAVYAALEEQLAFKTVPAKNKVAALRFLGEVVGQKSRLENLKVATLLHDIAKPHTLIAAENGTAHCPGHEHIAAGMVHKFADVFDLDVADTSYVKNLVLHHGFISAIVAQAVAKPDKATFFWDMFVESVGSGAYELAIFMQADLQGSDLQKNDSMAFHNYTNQLAEWIQEKIPKSVLL